MFHKLHGEPDELFVLNVDFIKAANDNMVLADDL